jgi:predicted TPR repeat methyltransferase
MSLAASSDYKKLGNEHLRRNELVAAAECYRQAIAADANDVDAHVNLGFALREQKLFSESEHFLRIAISIDPQQADAHYILGSLAEQRNDINGAITHFFRVLEIQPQFEVAYRDLGLLLVRDGQSGRARDVFAKAAAVFPDAADFQSNLGNLLSQATDLDGAVICYQKALAIQPNSREAHNNLGCVFEKLGRFDEAESCYQRALSISPDFVDSHINLGNLKQRQGCLDDAANIYRRAIALAPDNADVNNRLGAALLEQGKFEEAIRCFQRATALTPDEIDGHLYLGNAFLANRSNEMALRSYAEVLRLEPEHATHHVVTALSGGASDGAPRQYVEQLFDGYAEKFDSHLVRDLRYDIPQQLVNMLSACSRPTTPPWDVLDLGCGTGLVGEAIARYARQLVGVDLSGKMLAKARARNIYERLVHMDVVAMMRNEPEKTFDLVAAADVFIYVGKLDELVREARRVLRDGGLFAFSVESLDALPEKVQRNSESPDLRLNPTGRYAQSIRYLTRLAAENGFQVLRSDRVHVRQNEGRAVEGYLVLWTCA